MEQYTDFAMVYDKFMDETPYEKFFAILRMIVLFPKTIFEKLFGGLFK